MENKAIDASEELMNPAAEHMDNPYKEKTIEAEGNVRTLNELMKVDYKDLTENEKQYMISALKVKTHELNSIIESVFAENKNIKTVHNTDLRMLEETLTYIKTVAATAETSINLAIKNAEREVKSCQ